MAGGVDPQLLNNANLYTKEEEKKAAKEIRQRKKQAQKLQKNITDELKKYQERARSQNQSTSDPFNRKRRPSSEELSPEEAEVHQAQQLLQLRQLQEQDLQKELQSAKFEGASFWGILLAAMIKDAIDIFSLGTIGWSIINWIFWLVLALFIWINSSFWKRRFRKKLIMPLLRLISAATVESIPFVVGFPAWTITILLFKKDANQDVNNILYQIEENQKEMVQLQKRIS